MKIKSIQIGPRQSIKYRGQMVETGIFKNPVAGPVLVKKLSLEGDVQADLRVHGGRDKAVYAYSCDAYEDWKRIRPQDSFNFGAMGENLSIDHLPEDKICVGDVFEIGQAILQVTQPRFPCFKLAAKFNDSLIIKQFIKFGRSGIYFRVLKEGFIDFGHELKLIEQEDDRVSVREVFQREMTA